MKQDVHFRSNLIDPLVPTVYHEPWWLEIAADGRYKVVEFSEGEGSSAGCPISFAAGSA